MSGSIVSDALIDRKPVARKWMRDELLMCRDLYDDCGEINCTMLAENCADAFDIYVGPEEDIPEWVFDLSVDISAKFQNGDNDD